MGKWTKKSLEPSVTSDSDNHIAVEDIARVAEGTVANAEREHLLSHINRCRRCYEILQQTLKNSPWAASGQASAGPWWKTNVAYALAASIILIFIISGPLVYQHWRQGPRVISVTLDLDQELKDILLEDDALRFGQGPRLRHLLAVLQQKGLPVKNLNLVVLSRPYYQKKSLFGPKEILHIRIEDGVAYLEVNERD